MLDTNDKGIIFQPYPTKGLECHVIADFSVGWASGEHSNPEVVYLELDLLFPMLVARSTGAENFRLKFILAQLNQNTLLFPWQ